MFFFDFMIGGSTKQIDSAQTTNQGKPHMASKTNKQSVHQADDDSKYTQLISVKLSVIINSLAYCN